MIYFTSDTHFWHRAVMGYCNRPWDTVEEMNEGLIERWNSRVGLTDTVYHLGDFAFCGTGKATDIFNRLHGFKHLIRGNHDGKTTCKLGWQSIKDYYVLRAQSNYEDEEGIIHQFHQPIVLMHFPILSWDGMHHGSWHLHGHCHGSLPDHGGKRMDVGVDPNDWYPLSFSELQYYMQGRQFRSVDHHGKER